MDERDDTPQRPGGGPRWTDQSSLLTDLALQDLRDGGEVRPTFVAFRGDDALFLATLRAFAKGAYHEPMIELGVLAMHMGADRLAVSFGGRAWSLQDPVPPIVPELGERGDLRQRVLLVHAVDGTQRPLRAQVRIHPVGGRGRNLRLDPPLDRHQGEGWIPDALEVFVEQGIGEGTLLAAGDGPDGDLAAVAARCERAGHSLAWGEAGLRLLEASMEAVADRDSDVSQAREAA